MTPTLAYATLFVILAGAFIGAVIAGLIYVRTDGRAGGFFCLILILVTLSDGASLWHLAYHAVSP